MSYTQTNRALRISTPLGEDAFLLTGMRGSEGISRLFEFDLELASESDSVDFQSLVGKNVTFAFTQADGSDRYWNGYVSRFSLGTRSQYLTSYRATVVPWLWFLSRTTDCRIFQRKKAPDIVRQVFEDLGFRDFELRLFGSFAEREYCVQYRETDLNFVSRLLEEEGVSYFFSHENGKHTLVLTNDPAGFKRCSGNSTLVYNPVVHAVREEDAILDWRESRQFRSKSYSLADYNFETPSDALDVSVPSRAAFDIYDYPGDYRKRDEGDTLARIRIEEESSQEVAAGGASDCRQLNAGFTFTLSGHYRSESNGSYLLTVVHHMVRQGGVEVGSSAAELTYRNEFECVPAATSFRPARVTPRPFVQGCQTAVVVGPSGEEIYTDSYGRVKVQFYWDREGQRNENSSCWIRASQAWAGKNWGSISIPRIGQEVVVDFLEGNPDRPLIVGRVYNAEQMPPYKLPAEQTKSTTKSYSSKGGGGFNEIRFEDAKGNEQVFIHAERNQDIRIKKDLFETVGEERHSKVGKDRLEQVGGDTHLTVTGDQNEKIGGTVSLNGGADYQAKIAANYAMQAGTEIHLKAGMNVVLESGTTLTLKVGGSFVNLSPAGVFISGPMVMINSGGSAGSGSGASPQSPKSPKEADNAEPGQASVVKPPAPSKAAKFSPAAVVLKEAARSGAPFCDI